MTTETVVDEGTGRKFTLDFPEGARHGGVTFLLNLHGGGSVGAWQRRYFPAFELVDRHGLVVATPSSATKEPFRMWVAEADDDHLRTIVDHVFARFGPGGVRAFWLVGHSQGGMTSNRLLRTPYFAERVDGWLSLSGGRLGAAELVPDFGPPPPPGQERPPRPEGMTRLRRLFAELPEADFSFIFATGEHEIVALPETSPWAERYGAGPRQRLEDVVDDEPGRIHDTLREGRSNAGWGLLPRPGRAEVYVYPGARDGRVVADVVRIDKGHTEGLEPRITEWLVQQMVAAPGGKAPRAASPSA
jgi:hypothetical protein